MTFTCRALARLAVLLAVPLAATAVLAQEGVPALEEIKNQAQLDKAITELDRQLFDAYNHCDLKKFDSLLSDDVEFYHDQGGVTRGHAALTESLKNNICTGDTQRVLVPGSLRVYFMQGYGAIEMGVHRFIHPKTEKTNGTGEASFVHLWQYQAGAWKVTRVLSYDHHSVAAKP